MLANLSQFRLVEETRPLIAGDHTPWARPEAKTLQDRTSQHSPKSKGNVVLGQGYSTLAWIPEPQGSWALPLRHELITSFESPPDNPLPWQKRQLRSEMTRPSRCTGICFTFSDNWNSCSTTQTARKVRRLEKRKKKK